MSSNKRFTGTLKVDPKLMGKLIGKGGCNIRRITSQVRAGCYIRGNGDTFEISAWTQKAVRDAAAMIKLDQAALKDPTKRPSKPFTLFKIDPEIVPHVVGRGGAGLNSIMAKVGDGCFIVHRDGAFHISANSKSDLSFAKRLILQVKNEFLATTPSTETQQTTSQISSGKYDALALSDSDDELSDDESQPFTADQIHNQIFDYNGAGSIRRHKVVNQIAKKVASATDVHISQVDKSLIHHQFDHSSPTVNMPTQLPKQATFPQLPGTSSEGNVQLEITDSSSWKNALTSNNAPLTDSYAVIRQRELRKKSDMKDQYAKYINLFHTTVQKADISSHDQKSILTQRALKYKAEADRIHKILNPSWADMCDDDSDDDHDYSLGNL